MNLESLLGDLAAHWRVVAVALAVSWLTALFGKDSRFPISVPDRFKAPLTIALGQAVEGAIAFFHNEPWKQAAFEGIGASCGALAAFALLVKFVGNGKVPAPLAWLALFTPEAKARNSAAPPPSPSAGGGPTIAGAALLLLAMGGVLGTTISQPGYRYPGWGAYVAGCAAAGPILRAVLSSVEGGCVLFHEEIEDEEALAKTCKIANEKRDALRDLVSARREAAGMKKASLARDAGGGG